MRENADRLEAEYAKVHVASMNEVDRLLKTRVCHINRIGGDLDRTIESLHEWIEAELKYWRTWDEAEMKRVDGLKKSLESMQHDQQRMQEQIETETKDHEELLRRKANLEQYGKRTQEIVKEIDALVVQIQDSEDALAEAQKRYTYVTDQVKIMSSEIDTRITFMREQVDHTTAYGFKFTSYYEEKRKDAEEVCNTKRPGASRTPLPGNSKPVPQSQP
jgi:chromosome segregation ATPase